MKILALTGAAGSGKGTAAALLATHTRASLLAFASPLYAEVANAYHCTISQLLERSTKEQPQSWLALHLCTDRQFAPAVAKALGRSIHMTRPRSPHQILQWWGTEYRRSSDADYWARKCYARLKHLAGKRTPPPLAVISGLRYANEAQLVRALGGQIWQITRPGHGCTTGHASDVDGSQFAPDLVLHNRHNIEHLQSLVLNAWCDWQGEAQA